MSNVEDRDSDGELLIHGIRREKNASALMVFANLICDLICDLLIGHNKKVV